MLAERLLGYTPGFPLLLVEFVLSGCVVLFLATRLSHYADALEKKTDISAIWIGGIFLAIVTSLPEAVTTLGSTMLPGALNLGVSNLFGSNVFNLLIIVVLDLFKGARPLMLTVESGLLVAAAGGLVLMGLVGVAIGFYQPLQGAGLGGWIGPVLSLVIFGSYVALGRLTTLKLPIPDTSVTEPGHRPAAEYDYSRRQIAMRLFVFAVLLVAAAVWLLRVCDLIALAPINAFGHTVVLGQTVTGTFLLSAATSFPEFFVCIAALRLGQTNMAVANVLGSNMVNLSFVPLMHLFTRDPFFYAHLNGPILVVLLSMGVLMTSLLMLGVLVRSPKRYFMLGWETACMLAVYVAGAFLVLRMGLR